MADEVAKLELIRDARSTPRRYWAGRGARTTRVFTTQGLFALKTLSWATMHTKPELSFE